MEGWGVIVIPILTALVSGAVASILTRRSNKESNATNAFNVAVASVLSVNDSLRKDVENLKRDQADLNTKYAAAESKVRELTDKVDDLQDANRMLADHVARLVENWPPGTPMPPLSDEWRKYLS